MAKSDRTKENAYLPQDKLILVRGGKEYFERLQEIISNAQSYIHLQMYIFSYDATGRMVFDWLLQSVTRGVSIYLLVDGYATKFPQELGHSLKGTNFHIEYYAPLFKNRDFYFGRRMHHKIVVADGCCALVGSNNIDDHYYGSQHHTAWMDFALYLEGAAAVTLHQISEQMWHRATGKRNDFFIPAASTTIAETRIRAVSVRICRNDWSNNLQEITKSYVNLLSKARDSVYLVSSYFLPGKSLRKQMRAAVQRGVKVKVITAGISDVAIAKRAEKYLYPWLLRHKIEVYEYHDNILHAKMGVRDGKWLTLGSFNINNISTYASIELNLEVRNRPFVKEVQDELETIITCNCEKITEEEFLHKQTLMAMLLQRLSYDFIRVLLFLFTFYFKRNGISNKFY